MAVYPEDVAYAKSEMMDGEQAIVTATQRKVGPGGALVNQTTVVATDRRLLLLNRATLGLRKDVESIPYNRIASVRMEKGFISSSVFLQVAGYTSSLGERGFLKPGEQEGEIGGLHKADAKALADYINKMISQPSMAPAMQPQQQQQQGGVFCTKCGARNNAGAKFCQACGAKIGK